MQTIFRVSPASNFTIYANDLINSDIPPTPKAILIYLLSKPDTWRVKAHDIRKQLGLSAYAVKNGLRWLMSAGFAAYSRLKSGHTIWQVFSNPKENSEFSFAQTETDHSPAIPPQVEIPQVAFQPVLVITETEKIKKPLPTATLIQENTQHVVVDSELIYPAQLTDPQKKAAKHIIKKVKEPELQQPVLFALAYAITSGTVKSPVAYLNGLISRANNGTFEAIQAAGTTKADNRHIDSTQALLAGYRQLAPSKPEAAQGHIRQARYALRGMVQ
jgi:hypothetical protein